MYPVLSVIAQLNNSKLFWGLSAVFLNLGSRFVITDMTDLQARFFSRRLAKVLVVFCMVFLSTRDVLISLAMSIIIVLVMFGLVNERSPYCIIPTNALAVGGAPNPKEKIPITLEMYKQAREIVELFEEARKDATKAEDAETAES